MDDANDRAIELEDKVCELEGEIERLKAERDELAFGLEYEVDRLTKERDGWIMSYAVLKHVNQVGGEG